MNGYKSIVNQYQDKLYNFVCHTHLLNYKKYSTNDPISVIFYSTDLHNKIYNMNGSDYQNKLKIFGLY